MISTSDTYKKELYEAERELHCTLDFNDGTIIELTDEDIVQGSFSFKESAVNGSFTVGGMIANQVDVTFYLDLDNLYLLVDAILKIKLTYKFSDGTTQDIPIGNLYVDASTVKRTSNNISFSAFDAMVRFDKNVPKNTIFKSTLSDFVKDICTQCNVDFDTSTLSAKANNDLVINFKTSQTYTYRELMSYALQLMGCFGRINRETGKFEIVPFSDSPDFVINEDNAVSRDVSDSVMSVTGVQFSSVMAGTDGYVLDLSSNPILASYVINTKDKNGNTKTEIDAETVNNILYTTLVGMNGVQFCNANVTWFGDLSVQAGDCFTYKQDGLYGGNRKIIVMEQECKLNGTSTIKSYGTNKAVMYSPFSRLEQNVVDVKGDYDQVMGDALTIIDKGLVDAKKDLDQAVKDATDQITGNKGGYVVMRPSTHPEEILIMDTDSIDTATNVWRWNKSGLGHSSNGYAGPYGTAITQDGKIVADYILGGTLEGKLIKAGSIETNAISMAAQRTLINKAVDSTTEEITQQFKVGNGTFYSAVSDKFVKGDDFTEYKSTIQSASDKISLRVDEVKKKNDELSDTVAKINIDPNKIVMTVDSDDGKTRVVQGDKAISFTAEQFKVNSDNLFISQGKIASQILNDDNSVKLATVLNKGILRVRSGDRNSCILLPCIEGAGISGCYGSSGYGQGIVFGAVTPSDSSIKTDHDANDGVNWKVDSIFYRINFNDDSKPRHEFTGAAKFNDKITANSFHNNDDSFYVDNGMLKTTKIRIIDRLAVYGNMTDPRFVVDCSDSSNRYMSCNIDAGFHGSILSIDTKTQFSCSGKAFFGDDVTFKDDVTINSGHTFTCNGDAGFHGSKLNIDATTTTIYSNKTFTCNGSAGFHGSTNFSNASVSFSGASVNFSGASVSGLSLSASYPSSPTFTSVSTGSINVNGSSTLVGDVSMKNSLSVSSTVHSKSLIVDNNARINGILKMGSSGITSLQYDTSLNPLLRLGNTSVSLSLVGSKISSNKSITVGSDQRIKNHIENLNEKYIKMVDLLQAKTYFLNDYPDGSKNVGFIAQEVLDVLSQVGLTAKEFDGFCDVYGNGSMYALGYDEFIPILWEYCKQLKQEIEKLKGEKQ